MSVALSDPPIETMGVRQAVSSWRTRSLFLPGGQPEGSRKDEASLTSSTESTEVTERSTIIVHLFVGRSGW